MTCSWPPDAFVWIIAQIDLILRSSHRRPIDMRSWPRCCADLPAPVQSIRSLGATGIEITERWPHANGRRGQPPPEFRAGSGQGLRRFPLLQCHGVDEGLPVSGRRYRVAGEDEPVRGELDLLGAGFGQACAGPFLDHGSDAVDVSLAEAWLAPDPLGMESLDRLSCHEVHV